MDKPLPSSISSYNDAIKWIYGRINYEHTRPKRSSDHFRLERIERLLKLIDSPQERIPVVHIAGTKGKGSTAAMVDSILRASGYRTGLFTSPHIRLFEERMRVDGVYPDERQLTDLVTQLASRLSNAVANGTADSPTYFEVATLLSWMYFDQENVDLAVLETGLGGRLDCTNVCKPLVTGITTIGLDHTHILGDTIEKIAWEKAGIVKKGVSVVTSATQTEVVQVIQQRADDQGSECVVLGRDFHLRTNSETISPAFSVEINEHLYRDLQLSLQGRFQKSNAALAVAMSHLLSRQLTMITDESVRNGLATTEWPLRLEVIEKRPLIILDAAHNPDAIEALVDAIGELQLPKGKRVLLFAASRDKDADGMLDQALAHFDAVVLTQFETNPRSVPVEDLTQMASQQANATLDIQIEADVDPGLALKIASDIAGKDGTVCVAGSIFLSAEVRELVIR